MIFYAVAAFVWVILGVVRTKQAPYGAVPWFALGAFGLAIVYGFMAWKVYRTLRRGSRL